MGAAEQYIKAFEALETGVSIGSSYSGQFGEELEIGIPHYTKDGVLYEGPTHMDAEGRLMTGEVYTEDSEYLYHMEDLEFEQGPCQDGYVQIGVKDKDGRVVPNCVPEESANK